MVVDDLEDLYDGAGVQSDKKKKKSSKRRADEYLANSDVEEEEETEENEDGKASSSSSAVKKPRVYQKHRIDDDDIGLTHQDEDGEAAHARTLDKIKGWRNFSRRRRAHLQTVSKKMPRFREEHVDVITIALVGRDSILPSVYITGTESVKRAVLTNPVMVTGTIMNMLATTTLPGSGIAACRSAISAELDQPVEVYRVAPPLNTDRAKFTAYPARLGDNIGFSHFRSRPACRVDNMSSLFSVVPTAFIPAIARSLRRGANPFNQNDEDAEEEDNSDVYDTDDNESDR